MNTRKQNVGACADYVHIWRSIFLLFWPSKVPSSRLLPDHADVLLLKDVILSSCSHQVTGCRWPPRFYGWTLSRTVPAHFYWPAMQKCHKILASTKYRRPPRFHWFSPNFTSHYLCSQASYQKLVKAKSDHHHCPISVFYSWPPYRGCHKDPPLRLRPWFFFGAKVLDIFSIAGRHNKPIQYGRESAHKSREAGVNASLDDCMHREQHHQGEVGDLRLGLGEVSSCGFCRA